MVGQPNLITGDINWQQRKCSKCGEYKPATGHLGEPRQWSGYRCPDCKTLAARMRRPERTTSTLNSPYRNCKIYRSRVRAMPAEIKEEFVKEQTKWKGARKKYGLRKIDWLLLYHQQNGKCGICTAPFDETKVNVDHDHQTGRVRGLLCQWCNIGMSYIDRPDWMKPAQVYKSHHEKRND